MAGHKYEFHLTKCSSCGKPCYTKWGMTPYCYRDKPSDYPSMRKDMKMTIVSKCFCDFILESGEQCLKSCQGSRCHKHKNDEQRRVLSKERLTYKCPNCGAGKMKARELCFKCSETHKTQRRIYKPTKEELDEMDERHREYYDDCVLMGFHGRGLSLSNLSHLYYQKLIQRKYLILKKAFLKKWKNQLRSKISNSLILLHKKIGMSKTKKID